MLTLHLAGLPLQLWAQRAAYLPSHATLLVADAHIGKDASFRRLGVPVPAQATAGTLARLTALVAQTQAQRVVFLGDLVHNAASHAAAPSKAFAQWRLQHRALDLVLVRGNHDHQAGPTPPAWGVQEVAEPWPLGPFALVHHPQAVAGHYALAGHLHPAHVLRGRGGAARGLRLPCFHFGAEVGVLPAFGEFTGSHAVLPAPGDRVAVIVDDEVRELPCPARGRAESEPGAAG